MKNVTCAIKLKTLHNGQDRTVSLMSLMIEIPSLVPSSFEKKNHVRTSLNDEHEYDDDNDDDDGDGRFS